MYQPKSFIAQFLNLHPQMNQLVNFQRFLFKNVTKIPKQQQIVLVLKQQNNSERQTALLLVLIHYRYKC